MSFGIVGVSAPNFYEKEAMTNFDDILLERIGTEGRIARITLNRPEKANTLTHSLFSELDDCLHELEADHDVRVVILRGAGKGFSGGYDVQPPRNENPRVHHPKFFDKEKRPLMANMRVSYQQITDVQLYFWNMQKITIAQLHGFALAGGCELAMMADLVVASEDCKIGHPGVRGLGTARNGNIWPLVMGMRKAKELYYTGENVTGTQAEEYGMINYAWPADELEAKTLSFAERIAIMSSDHLAMLKLTMNRFYENMGIYSSLRSATEQDILAQATEFAYSFGEQVRENGLKAAIDWRDRPYDKKDY